MEVDWLKLFNDVAQRGSFAATARAWDMDPSTVSRAIAALEEAVGVRLFQRSTRRVSLTEAGERYWKKTSLLVEELESAGDEARLASEVPSGVLRLTASVAFGQVV